MGVKTEVYVGYLLQFESQYPKALLGEYHKSDYCQWVQKFGR